jgi:amidase
MDHSMDFICPMARTVGQTALALEVMAGYDERDPQWLRGKPQPDEYSKRLDEGVAGLRIGVLKEGFSWPESDAQVSQSVMDSVQKLEREGAVVSDVSVPLFTENQTLFIGVLAHGMSAMFESDGEGYWHQGAYDPGWHAAFGSLRRSNSDSLSPRFRFFLLLGKYLRDEYASAYYAKAQSVRRALARQVDRALEAVDVLALPTTPSLPSRLPEPGEDRTPGPNTPRLSLNTATFNLTGHPALSVPAAPVGDLSVGLQLAGRHWEETRLLSVAAAVEREFEGEGQ